MNGVNGSHLTDHSVLTITILCQLYISLSILLTLTAINYNIFYVKQHQVLYTYAWSILSLSIYHTEPLRPVD